MKQFPFQINPLVAALYDAMMIYAWAYNKSLVSNDGNDKSTTERIKRFLWNNLFYNGNPNIRYQFPINFSK